MAKPGPKIRQIENRLREKVRVGAENECWEFTGFKDKRGRGQIYHNGKPRMAHRVAAELAGMDIPAGMVICHKCDNPSCCNPSHFFIGTQAENLADMRRKGRGVLPKSPPWNGIKRPRIDIETAICLSDLGWRQKEIARTLMMSESHVSRILSRKTRAVY